MKLFSITGYENPQELTDIALEILSKLKAEKTIVIPARDKQAARLLTSYLADSDTSHKLRSVTIMDSCAIIVANDSTELPFDLDIIDHVKRNQ